RMGRCSSRSIQRRAINEKPAPNDAGSSFPWFEPPLLDGGDGRSLCTLRTFGYFEADTLAFLQAAKTRVVDGRIMHENIVTTVLGRDETEALGVIEPFDCTETH